MKCEKCPLCYEDNLITDDTEEYDYGCLVGEVPDGEGCHRTNKWINKQNPKVIREKAANDEIEYMEKYIEATDFANKEFDNLEKALEEIEHSASNESDIDFNYIYTIHSEIGKIKVTIENLYRDLPVKSKNGGSQC